MQEIIVVSRGIKPTVFDIEVNGDNIYIKQKLMIDQIKRY